MELRPAGNLFRKVLLPGDRMETVKRLYDERKLMPAGYWEHEPVRYFEWAFEDFVALAIDIAELIARPTERGGIGRHDQTHQAAHQATIRRTDTSSPRSDRGTPVRAVVPPSLNIRISQRGTTRAIVVRH
jgi:hypothetical protein